MIEIDEKKEVIFIQRSHTHCTCQEHWNFCLGEAVPFNCVHQIIYDLWVKIFAPEGVKIKESVINKEDELSELMGIL